MKFQKGKPKTGGRQKGVKNKSTSFIERCDSINLDILNCLIQDLAEMLPFQRVDYWIKMLEFYYPKQKTLEIGNAQGSEGFKIVIEDYGKK